MRKVPRVGHGVGERVVSHGSDVWGDEEDVHNVRGRMIYVDCAIQVIYSEEDLNRSLDRERDSVISGLVSAPLFGLHFQNVHHNTCRMLSIVYTRIFSSV